MRAEVLDIYTDTMYIHGIKVQAVELLRQSTGSCS